MSDIDPQIVAAVGFTAAAGVLVLLGVVTVLALRLRKLRRDQLRAFRGVEDDVLSVLGRQADELAVLRREVGAAHADTAQLRELLRDTVSRVAIHRYDAFDDMGGALSFSAALLDERGDGIVLSAINGRSETRCYAKPVVAGNCELSLSAEEVATIDAAVVGRRTVVSAPAGRRRRRAS